MYSSKNVVIANRRVGLGNGEKQSDLLKYVASLAEKSASQRLKLVLSTVAQRNGEIFELIQHIKDFSASEMTTCWEVSLLY